MVCRHQQGSASEAADGSVQVGSHGRADVRIPGLVAARSPTGFLVPTSRCWSETGPAQTHGDSKHDSCQC